MISWHKMEQWLQKEGASLEREGLLALQRREEALTLPICYGFTFEDRTIPRWTSLLERGTRLNYPTARKIANNLVAYTLREHLETEGKGRKLEELSERELKGIIEGPQQSMGGPG